MYEKLIQAYHTEEIAIKIPSVMGGNEDFYSRHINS